ncbi:MAG: 2-oxoacid:acceptor oxidoreductase family protein [bacterium]
MEIKIIIAGSGGQGILFLGRLICQAAMIEGKHVTWFPSYGAEMRGGTANCTVVISDDFIGSPVVQNPDVMIILNQASLNRFLNRIREKGSLFYDSSLIPGVVERDTVSLVPIPSSRIAGEIGNPRLSNMVLLGAFVKLSRIVSEEDITRAVSIVVPAQKSSLIEKNILAINKGADFAAHQKSCCG